MSTSFPYVSGWNGNPDVLIIRKSQLDALGEVARRSFEDKMLDHLAGFSPSLVSSDDIVKLINTRPESMEGGKPDRHLHSLEKLLQ
ncbi:hypothetical protein F0U60_15740 [Archangium minus]|uniref:Uncharacterized protein n=1 Tax=Archangium minus TaxID=83450 RepID=A0ABY9WSG0_9BACT|nr:hypothetical protein F0U60_15740 [Archangium minus]